MDYEKIKAYFAGSTAAGFYGLFGSVLVLGGIGGLTSGNTDLGIIGIIALIGGLILIALANLSDKGMSDSEYDEAVARYADSLKSRTLPKLGVDDSEVNEIAPIFMGGYNFEEADKVKQGQDKIWRSNVYKSIMLFFSRSELHCYTIIFKTTENLILGEATDVYFYQDIVSVSTASVNDKITIDGKELIINAEAFKLTTKGGTSLTVNIIDSRHAQESVNAMRALLREKKSS